MGIDHGELKGGLDAEIVRQVAVQQRENLAAYREYREAARKAEAERVRFTADDLRGPGRVAHMRRAGQGRARLGQVGDRGDAVLVDRADPGRQGARVPGCVGS